MEASVQSTMEDHRGRGGYSVYLPCSLIYPLPRVQQLAQGQHSTILKTKSGAEPEEGLAREGSWN